MQQAIARVLNLCAPSPAPRLQQAAARAAVGLCACAPQLARCAVSERARQRAAAGLYAALSLGQHQHSSYFVFRKADALPFKIQL
jgi:hypothetical protein